MASDLAKSLEPSPHADAAYDQNLKLYKEQHNFSHWE